MQRMRKSTALVTAGLLNLVVALAGCGGGGNTTITKINGGRTPSLTSMSPESALVGSAGFTLTLNGLNFASSSTVEWNGAAVPTTFVSRQQVTAAISSALVASAGYASVTVENNASQASNALEFGVHAPSQPPPVSLSPASVVAGSGDLTLTVTGSGFDRSTVVLWDGYNFLRTIFVSQAQVKATVPSSDIGSAGYINVSVQTDGSVDPTPAQFRIYNPAPQIISISPDHATAGAAPISLTINCNNFLIVTGSNLNTLGATLLVDGSTRKVDSFTGTQLVTTLSVSDLAVARTISIQVANPDPAVGPSNQILFTVAPFASNPAPTLVSVSDASVPQGWPGFPLTVYGTGFVAGSVVEWGGVNRATTAISSTELQAAIPASDLAAAGTIEVSVTNPSPGGGATSTLPVQVFAVSPDAIGVIDRSDIGTDLTQPDGDNVFAAVNADGRYVTFQSDVANPSVNPSGVPVVLLRDTCIGAPGGCVPSVTLVPGTPTAPLQWNDAPYRPAISADGRFIGFSSNTDFVLYDNCLSAPAGCVPADRTVASTEDSNGYITVSEVSLSADGRLGVSISGILGCNWVNGCYDTGDAFLTTTCAGASSDCTPTYVPFMPDGQEPVAAGGEIYRPSISPDGRFVAFNWSSSDPDNYNWTDAFNNLWLFDSCQGASADCSISETMITMAMDGSSADGYSYGAAMSSGARYVAFISYADNLVPGIPGDGLLRLYLRDLCTGAPDGCVPATTLVLPLGDAVNLDAPSISADGRYIAFSSDASDLVPGDTNGVSDVFVHDTCIGAPSGCTPSTVRVSVALDGTQGNADSGRPVISADGRFVVFISAAKLGPGVPSGLGRDVYLARH